MTEQELSVEVVDDEPAWKGNVRAIGALYMMLVAAVVVFFALSTWRWSDWFEGFVWVSLVGWALLILVIAPEKRRDPLVELQADVVGLRREVSALRSG